MQHHEIDKKIKYYRRNIIISIFAFIAVTILTAIDLNSLEKGTEDRVSVFAPAGFMYEHFGYWPSLIIIPIIGIFVVLAFLKAIRKLKQQQLRE
jgi:cytochrome bd-type quinol oxidase subunit 2